MSDFGYVSSKLGNVKPETKSIAHEIYVAAQKAGHDIWFMWGMGSSGEHATGNALDLMVRNEAAGDWIRNYIWTHRKRLRLRHVIWEQHITSTVVQPGVRRLMADRGSTTENHFDHNHVWFFPGTYQAPTREVSVLPTVLRPKPSPGKKPVVKVRVLRRGTKGADVKRLQAEMNRVFPAYPGKLAVDGDFGRATEETVKEFQRRAGLTPDGVVGPKTRAKLKSMGVRL
jgi:peptidoglycan hydrolase-like protein with peptidoglycan-binding domain